jgi:hypothetical protein
MTSKLLIDLVLLLETVFINEMIIYFLSVSLQPNASLVNVSNMIINDFITTTINSNHPTKISLGSYF